MRRWSIQTQFLPLMFLLLSGASALSQQPLTPLTQQLAAPPTQQPATPSGRQPLTPSAQGPSSQMLHKRVGPPSRTIYLDVLATQKSGQPLTGLKAGDFALLIDKKPEKITSFAEISAKDHPVEAIVLIDSINTDYDVVSQVRQQLDQFLRANGGKLPLPTALAVLTSRGVEMQGSYSTDGKLLDAALSKYTIGLREIRRSAGMVGYAERLEDSQNAMRLLATYELSRPGRKLILWISPGWRLLSGPEVQLSYDQLVSVFNAVTWLSSRLRQGQVTVYCLDPLGVEEPIQEVFYYQQFLAGVKNPGAVQLGDLGLQVIATQTGGLVLNSPDIAQLLTQCMAENMDYYRMAFEPPPSKGRDRYKGVDLGEFHSVKLSVGQPDVTVHTSTGYYLRP